MAEFKAKTADGRGLTFDISGPSPTPQEQAEINAHIQNYNRLFPTYTQAAPVPAEEELGPWGAGWRGLYADTQSMAAGILQGLGAPEMAQRFEEDANRVRRETAERYKPLAFSDINNLSDVGTFAYQAGVGSLPYMIPGLIGGGIAGLGARALGGAAATYAPAAAAAGYAGAMAPTRIGGIASRMAEEQGTTLSQIDWTKAVATGAASTALDLVTPQVLGVFGKFAGAAKVGDEIATGAINSWWKSLPKNVIKAAGTEAGTETAQQAMEIWAANPEKFYELGPDVREELITAAVAGGLLGPIFEVATGGFAAEQSALAKAREKRRRAQEALDALIVQGDAANAEQIRQLREDYSKALAEEKAFSESDQADVPFGPDTPRYRPSDDMGRYRAEVIVSDQGTPAGYRVAGPTGESIAEDYPSFDAARMAAQVLNDSAPHSPSIMESYPVIPTSSLSASTREALVKKRFELGQAGLEANTSMTEIRNLLGDAIATLERERLTGSPDIPLQARMVAQSSPASTSVTPNIPPPAAPASAPAPTPAAPAVAPTVAPEKKKAAKTLKPRTKVVKAPVEVNPETATPTPQQPSAVPTEPDLNAMTDDELEAYLAEGAGEFTFRPGELGQQEDPDFARRKRGKQAAEATVNAAEQRPAPTGPRFTVQPIDATVAAPEGVPSGTLFEIFKDGKVIGSSSDLAQAQERARKILQKSPTASVRVRPKGRAYAVNEYRGSANGDVFVSTVRTFRDKAEADTYADTLNKMREERAQKRATNRAIIKRYEDLVAKQQAVVQRLMNRLRDLGMPENFRLLIRGVLQDPTKAVEDINIDAAGDTGIEGYYDAAAKTIAFAMDLYDPNLNEDQLYAKLVGVINHEFVHALQRAGSFTPAEWKVITKYLKSNQAYGRDGEKIPGQTWWERAEQMYGAQDQERVAREAMSEAFRSWARERKSVTGKPAGIFRRIVEMLKSLGRFGKTTPRVEQIFTEINAGKRSGVLKQDVLATQEAPDFSRRVSNIIDMTERRQAQIEEQFDREDADMIANMSMSGLARADAIILKHADLIRSLSAKLDLHYALSKYLPIGYTLAPRADTGPIEDVITDVVANDAVHKIMSGDISYSDMIESARQYGVNLRIDDPTRIPYDPGRRPGLRSLENQDAADSVGSSFKDKVASLDAGLDEARMLLPGKPKKWYRENNVMLGQIETDPGFAEAFKKYDDFVVGEKRKAIKLVAPEKAIDFSGRKVTPASFFDMKELAGWVEEAEARPSQTAIVKMTPDQFLDLATHGARDRAYFDKYAEKIDRGMKLSSVMSLRLKVESDGTLRIEGHEGRHRANAIKRLGYDEVPVKIFLTSDQAKVHNISEILSAPVKVIGQPPMTNEVDLDLRPFTRDDLQAAAVEPLRLSVGIAPVQTRIGLEKDQSPEALSRLVESGSDDARAQSRAVTEAMKEFSRPIAEAAKKGGARVYNTAGVGAYMNYDAEVSSGVAAVYDPDTKVSAINDVVAETFRLAREHDQYDAFVAINRGPSFSGPSARPSMTIWLNTQAGFDNHNRDVTSLTRIRDFLSRVRTENVAGFSIFQTQAQRGIEGGYEGITFVWVPEYANVTPENFDQNLVDTIREMDEVAKAIKDLNLGSITYTNYELILGSSTGPDSYETAAAGFIRDSANAGNFGEGRPVGRSVRDSVARRAQGVEQAQPSDNVGSVPARRELDEQALEDARAKYDVPAEVKKPNGDIDFSKRNLTLVPIQIKERKYGSEAEFSVKMVGSDKGIGELRGHVTLKNPETFQVDWASFDPDDMTIPETYGLIGLLLKHFPNVRRIVGYRISGAKFENRARRIKVAKAVADRAQVRFAENIMKRAGASSNPVERSFFKRYVGASADLICDTALRQVPELFDSLNESKIAYLNASEVLFQLQSMDQTQVIDVGRLIDRGAIDFSRRLVNTPEFKAWFKDSKVVNPDGSPMIVYHNTPKDFTEFRTTRSSFGAHFGTQAQANSFGSYEDNRIIPTFLSIQRPVRLPDEGMWIYDRILENMKGLGLLSDSEVDFINDGVNEAINRYFRAKDEYTRRGEIAPYVIDEFINEVVQGNLMQLGYDGVVYLNRYEGIPRDQIQKAKDEANRIGRFLTDDEYRALVPDARDSYIAFRPTQIKSALGNRGTFSSEDPRIDFSRRLVGTPEFKAWFKDSKVVNPDGSPRIVYHNTAASEDFSSFRTSSHSFGAHFGTPIQANYFGKARNYIDNRILPVFLSIQNPVRVRDLGAWPVFTVLSELKRAGAISESDLENIHKAIPDQTQSGVADPEASVTDMYSPPMIAAQRELIKLGIDGLVYLNRVEGLSAYSLDKANEASDELDRELTDDEFRAVAPDARDSYIVFRPTQIKSALSNSGTFSSEDPRIDFSRRKAVIKVVEKKKVEKLSRDERMEALAENFKRRPDLFEVASNVYGETLYIKKEITNAVPGIHDIIPFLRPDEIGLTNAKGAQSIMEMFTTVPSTEEMAAVAISGRAKRGWYERSAKALIDIFGPKDAPRFSALLAAMSPQSSVESNAKNAINMWVNWDRAGRPTDTKRILQIMGKSVQGKKGEKSALDSWKPNTLTALQTIDPHAITISGNKVNSFMLNLNDVVHAVTNDAWMANYGGVAQDKFTGPSYHGYSAKVRMAADTATQITGYKWTPREIQETIWSWSKTIYELRKKRGKGGGNETVGDLLKAGNVTNDMISKTPDFATLFANGVYRNILESGGYGTQIERIMSDERIEGRGGQADVALGDASIYDAEGTGIDERTYRRFLDTAAGRLEALYQRRKAEAAAKRARGEKLSEEGEDAEIDYSRRVTSTLEFQDWFGLSKVVDANGDPIIVYHGTSKDNDFSAFNIPRNGAWFTASPDDASAYAKENDSRKLVLGEGFRYIEKNTADRVLPVYLRIENPYKFTDADRDSLNNQPDRRDTGTAYRRWQAEFFDKLRREGYDGVDMGYGTWVVIGEPNQIKSAIGNNGKFDPTKKRIDYSRRTMPVTPADIANAVDRLRYTKVRNGIARALRGVTIAGKRIGLSDEAAMGTSRSFLDNFADHALPLGEIVDFVRENKGSIPDAFDAYLAQQVWSSEATDHINRTNDRLYNPLVRSIQNIKISDAEYNDFKKRFPSLAKVVEVAGDTRLGMLNALLYARHAPERNVIMNIMNEGKLPAGSGVPTPEAEAATKWFESRGDWSKYRQAEGIIRQIVEETNKIRVEYGLTPDFKNIPPPEVFKKAGMPGGYKFYVPLRGMIEEDMMPNDIDLQRLRTGLGFKIKGKEDLTAMGRDTLAKSVAEHVILQNEVSIVRAHKNKVGRSFYDLVANNQNLLLGIARIVEKAPLVRRVGDDGIVRLMVDPNYMNSDRFFVTKINGENKVVEIFDKRLARTLNGSTGYGSDAANQIINFIGGFTRLMSQLATGLNPEFWIRNTPRDVALAAVNLNQFEIPGLDATFMRNWPGAFKTARRANRFDWNFVKAGEERVPSGAEPDDILYNEFLEDGGFTGYLGLQSIETRIADLNKQITKGEEQGLQKGLEVGKRFAQFVEAINNTFENSTRFAVYKSLRESGFTRQRAAQGAKTITTNFNAGGWYKNMINPFYMFYNASLQGTLGILTALGRSKRVQKIAGSIMIAGFLQDLLMASLSDEDDTGALKYDGLKEHILRTHMVFADPTGMSGDGYIKVPMPYGYNAIFNFGRVVAKYIRHQATGGDYDLGKAIGSAVGTLADATNPLGATNSFMNFAAPTFLDPVVDLTTNRDFADRTIVKRPFGVGVDLPSSQLHLNSTSPTFVSIAEWLNSVSGGTDVMPGAIDFSPDAMQYLYDYFLSGAGAFVRRSFDLTTQGLPAALQGDFDAIQMSEVPMARALITRPAKVDMERYMEIRDEVMRIGKEAQEASRQSDMQRLENVREKYQKQLQVYGVVKAADSQRASINKRLAAIRENEKLTPEAKTNLIKQLKDQEEAAMIRAIRAYNFTVEGMSVPGMEQ